MDTLVAKYSNPIIDHAAEDLHHDQHIDLQSYDLPSLSNPSALLKYHTDEYHIN